MRKGDSGTSTPVAAEIEDRGDRYCVIGAGAAGLTAAKNLLEYRIPVDVVERASDVGGTWNPDCPTSGAYPSIHLITSKPYIRYTDFPIPAEYPTYLGQRHIMSYLRAYADHFGVREHIEFDSSVESVWRAADGTEWLIRVRTAAGVAVRRYRGVVIANGHNWAPRRPELPGTFDGLSMHAADYRGPDVLRGKRVLVIGAGTSGCDIAVESSQAAARTLLSVRRGNYIWPKYMFGMPTDAYYEFVLKFRMPRALVRAMGKPLLRLNSAGNPVRYGMPRPEHKLLEEHFVMNSTLLYQLGHGEIDVKPEAVELCGDHVRFADGSVEHIDAIVYATGYHQAEFPFIDRAYLNWSTGPIPALHLHAFHPEFDNLFVIGYFQISTGTWPIMDYQAQIMARYLHLLDTDPQRAAGFRKEKANPVYGPKLNGGINYYGSERHWLQVEHVSYRRRLRKLARRLAA
ncbi:SidA/IucD/PvdA family monooxygenase [Nocardia brasiliensis]|uniref:SidA/IucD/PvdA family monooxygenase n=1 Tax=Nocardia brasiliensis TaxID=37326 RepID=A0A6G9XML6_NOCBR|nr:NAD(P)-binding domain-containing protein [Nocardia brasiliensis]QIS02181.1 SidA/IucD/PvdA family monooxygenase [Nocardia brasiliensis]